jgi:iron(III) transport system substrate-binding protein
MSSCFHSTPRVFKHLPTFSVACVPLLILVGTFAGCVSRSESAVVVYSALDEEFAVPILDAFERNSEEQIAVIAKFDVESTKTVGLVNQIIAEQDRPGCDLFWNNEILHTVRLQKLGLLEPHSWNVDAAYPPDMIAKDGSWCGFAARARILIVNTDLLEDPDSYPRSVSELADPKWKDQCAMARPLFGTTATHFAVLKETMGEPAAVELLESIRDNAVILSGNKQVATAVSSGRVAWGLTDTDDAIVEKDHGLPVAIVFPDQSPDQPGTLRIPNTIAVIRGAEHPVAAGKLADYLLQAKTEERLAMGDSSQLPLNPQSKYRPRVLPDYPVRWMQADFEAAGADWEPWSQRLQEMFRQ